VLVHWSCTWDVDVGKLILIKIETLGVCAVFVSNYFSRVVNPTENAQAAQGRSDVCEDARRRNASATVLQKETVVDTICVDVQSCNRSMVIDTLSISYTGIRKRQVMI
jgi:hypothetical protein